MALARIWSIARLTKRAAPLSIIYQCAAFEELCNILVNRAAHQQQGWLGLGLRLGRTRVRVRVRFSVSFRALVFRVRVRLCLGLGLRKWPNEQRVWSNAHIDQMRLTGQVFVFKFHGKFTIGRDKREYVEISSNVDLHVERSIQIILRLHFWSLVTDCGFVLRTAFAQQNCEFRQCWVEIYYIILSSLHPQYGGQKAIDTHRYKLLQLVLSGDATLYNHCVTEPHNTRDRENNEMNKQQRCVVLTRVIDVATDAIISRTYIVG